MSRGKVLFRGKLRVPGCLALALVAIPLLLFCSPVSVVWNWGPLSGLRSGLVSNRFGVTPVRVVMQYENALNDTDINVWAEDGQSIVIDYDLTVEKGSMWFAVYGPRGWFQRWVLPIGGDPLGPNLLFRDVRTSGKGRFAVPAKGSGYYLVSIDPHKLTGSVDATVDVK